LLLGISEKVVEGVLLSRRAGLNWGLGRSEERVGCVWLLLLRAEE
jgi:hypothetical protein